MQVTLGLLQTLCPNTKKETLAAFVDPLNVVALNYGLSTNPRRLAAFLAQTAHESAGFSIIKENLNYSAKGLRSTFPKYFPTDELANSYARQPAKIANRVYANRMNNGDEASGDGYKFCGRGVIQLTGKFNYTKFAESIKMTVDDVVKYLETPAGAVSSAAWFWDVNGLNAYCDKGDIVGLTKRINGGTIGLTERQNNYTLALKLLKQQG